MSSVPLLKSIIAFLQVGWFVFFA